MRPSIGTDGSGGVAVGGDGQMDGDVGAIVGLDGERPAVAQSSEALGAGDVAVGYGERVFLHGEERRLGAFAEMDEYLEGVYSVVRVRDCTEFCGQGSFLVVLDGGLAAVVLDCGVGGVGQVQREASVFVVDVIVEYRHRNGGAGLTVRYEQGAADCGVIGAGGGAAVLSRVVDRHRGGYFRVEGDGEYRGSALALGHCNVCDAEVLVADGLLGVVDRAEGAPPDEVVVGHAAVSGLLAWELDLHVLVGVLVAVVDDVDTDRLGLLPGEEPDLAACLHVVDVGYGGRAVGVYAWRVFRGVFDIDPSPGGD